MDQLERERVIELNDIQLELEELGYYGGMYNFCSTGKHASKILADIKKPQYIVNKEKKEDPKKVNN